MAFDRGDGSTGTGTASVLPIDRGGTGADTVAEARTNLNLGALFSDSNGNVGIGTSSPATKLQVNPNTASGSNFNISGYDTGSGGANYNVEAFVTNYNNDQYGGAFVSGYARGTLASPAAVQNGDDLGGYFFQGHDGTAFRTRAGMGSGIDGAVSSGTVPANLVFRTGTTTFPPERMRIDSTGNVGIGTSSPVSRLEATTTGVTLVTAHTNSFTTAGDGSGFGAYRSVAGRLSGYSWTIATANIDGGVGGEYQLDAITFNTRATTTSGSLSEVMRISPSGDVGIGTTTPARKLHVSDVMRLEPRNGAPSSPSKGDLYFDSADDKLKCYDGTSWQNLF